MNEVAGCTDETALNYDPAATDDAGNCVLPIEGCIDPSACNYDLAANTDDGSCDYTSCFGCLNTLACNFNEQAIYPDASQCDFETCYGCDDNMACNYDDTAVFDDGSCDYQSCYGCTKGWPATTTNLQALMTNPAIWCRATAAPILRRAITFVCHCRRWRLPLLNYPTIARLRAIGSRSDGDGV